MARKSPRAVSLTVAPEKVVKQPNNPADRLTNPFASDTTNISVPTEAQFKEGIVHNSLIISANLNGYLNTSTKAIIENQNEIDNLQETITSATNTLQLEVDAIQTVLDPASKLIVRKVNTVSPDETGNVTLAIGEGSVKSVNEIFPDESGNVTIDVGVGSVKSVDSVFPDEEGNVALNAVLSVNNIKPTTETTVRDDWSPVETPLSFIRSLAVLSDGSILAGSGNGIWKSVDGGNTWAVTGKDTGYWYSFAVLSDGSILAGNGINDGIVNSYDDGNTWMVTSKDTGNWRCFAVLSNGDILTGGDNNDGIWKSTDNGNTWAVTSKTTGAWLSLVVLSNGDILAGSGNGIWKSVDGGNTWAVTGKDTGTWLSLAVLSNGDVLGGSNIYEGIWKSTDNGNTWTITGKDTGYWRRFAVLSNGDILVTDDKDGDIWKSVDGGNTWAVTAQTKESWYCFAVLSNGDILAGGDNGIIRRVVITTTTKGNVNIRPCLYDYKFQNLVLRDQSDTASVTAQISTWKEDTATSSLIPSLALLGDLTFFNMSCNLTTLTPNAGTVAYGFEIPLDENIYPDAFASVTHMTPIVSSLDGIELVYFEPMFDNIQISLKGKKINPTGEFVGANIRVLVDTSLRPTPPTSLIATVTDEQVTLNWDNPTRTLEEIL